MTTKKQTESKIQFYKMINGKIQPKKKKTERFIFLQNNLSLSKCKILIQHKISGNKRVK